MIIVATASTNKESNEILVRKKEKKREKERVAGKAEQESQR